MIASISGFPPASASDSSLDITGPEDTMILNIVTLPPDQSGKICLNLVGPIIVNRRNLTGKQCIINNHEEFSARHVLDVGGEGL